MKKTEGGETVLYVNQYFEKNLNTSEVTTHYYLGGKQVAYKRGNELRFPLDDHLFSSVGSMDTSGNKVATVKYFPFGGTRFQVGDMLSYRHVAYHYLEFRMVCQLNASRTRACIGVLQDRFPKSIIEITLHPWSKEMKPTRVIAWLLLLYWFSIAIANVSFFQGPSLRGGLEFPLYTGIGVVCYHATLKIGKHFPRPRKVKYYKGSSRR